MSAITFPITYRTLHMRMNECKWQIWDDNDVSTQGVDSSGGVLVWAVVWCDTVDSCVWPGSGNVRDTYVPSLNFPVSLKLL